MLQRFGEALSECFQCNSEIKSSSKILDAESSPNKYSKITDFTDKYSLKELISYRNKVFEKEDPKILIKQVTAHNLDLIRKSDYTPIKISTKNAIENHFSFNIVNNNGLELDSRKNAFFSIKDIAANELYDNNNMKEKEYQLQSTKKSSYRLEIFDIKGVVLGRPSSNPIIVYEKDLISSLNNYCGGQIIFGGKFPNNSSNNDQLIDLDIKKGNSDQINMQTKIDFEILVSNNHNITSPHSSKEKRFENEAVLESLFAITFDLQSKSFLLKTLKSRFKILNPIYIRHFINLSKSYQKTLSAECLSLPLLYKRVKTCFFSKVLDKSQTDKSNVVKNKEYSGFIIIDDSLFRITTTSIKAELVKITKKRKNSKHTFSVNNGKEIIDNDSSDEDITEKLLGITGLNVTFSEDNESLDNTSNINNKTNISDYLKESNPTSIFSKRGINTKEIYEKKTTEQTNGLGQVNLVSKLVLEYFGKASVIFSSDNIAFSQENQANNLLLKNKLDNIYNVCLNIANGGSNEMKYMKNYSSKNNEIEYLSNQMKDLKYKRFEFFSTQTNRIVIGQSLDNKLLMKTVYDNNWANNNNYCDLEKNELMKDTTAYSIYYHSKLNDWEIRPSTHIDKYGEKLKKEIWIEMNPSVTQNLSYHSNNLFRLKNNRFAIKFKKE